MTIADDLLNSAKLPKRWDAMYGGPHPTNDGTVFYIDWTYPMDMILANGKKVTFQSYDSHTAFINKACKYFEKTGKKHPWTV